MSVTTFARLGTANAYDNTVATLQTRQNKLSNLQETLSTGKKINTPSDDPTGAAQAERALNRLARIATDQRALETQRNSIASAESTLGGATDVLQQVRELVVSAGNGTFSNTDRKTVADQITGLRQQLLSLANTQDSNGQPLFAALGSALAPFTGPTGASPDYRFNGLPGTASSATYAIAPALDGDGAFMLQPARDASYNVQAASGSQLTTGTVALVAQAAVLPNAQDLSYTINNMSVSGSTVTYDLVTQDNSTDPATSSTQSALSAPWSASTGFSLTSIPGMSLGIKGTPTGTDSLSVTPNSSIFATLDKAVNGLTAATNSTEASQAVTQALHNIDLSMARISAIRGQAGDLLNRADSITSTNDKRTIEQKANQSRAEDVDMIQAVSEFQKQQTGYQAALQSYAMVQKLSLFNYVS